MTADINKPEATRRNASIPSETGFGILDALRAIDRWLSVFSRDTYVTAASAVIALVAITIVFSIPLKLAAILLVLSPIALIALVKGLE